MRAFLIGLLCLGVYTVPARYYYVCEYREDCKTGDNARNLVLPDRPNDLELLEAKGKDIPKGEHFAFYKGESDPVLSDDNNTFLEAVDTYLKDNPNSRIVITGDYYKGEKSDDKSTDNMGIARANKVIKELTAMKSSFKANRFKASSNQLDAGKLLNRPLSFRAQSLPDRPKDLALNTGGKTDRDLPTGYDHLAFYKGYSDPEWSQNNEDFLKGIAEYLKENPKKRLGVTGYYYKGEKSDHPTIDNMGIARATKIIDRLADMGFDRGRFKPDSKELKAGTVLNRPISFAVLSETVKGGEKLVEASYTFERMTFSDVNFDKGSAVLNPTTQFTNYIDSVKSYIDKNSNKTVTVIGHADSDGAALMNYNLGLARSKEVFAYLVKRGLKGEKIKNDSQGEKMPIAPNDNEENMRKNRRVEIIIE